MTAASPAQVSRTAHLDGIRRNQEVPKATNPPSANSQARVNGEK
jgi:hypothetical protein